MTTAALHLAVFQIVYSPETRQERDPGFIELDNLDNPRPDWREYWPMRRFLLSQDLDETTLYGFLSPKFRQKTGLSAGDVQRFVAADPTADVYIFSPFIDQSAFFLNVFEQGDVNHPGMMALAQEAAEACGYGVDLRQMVMSTADTIYCNYFVARPRFWRRWLEACEILFHAAETGAGRLGADLARDTTYSDGLIPMKVHVMERMASLVLAAEPGWTTRTYDPFGLPKALSGLAAFSDELVRLDALKAAWQRQPHQAYLTAFSQGRDDILRRLGTAP